MHGINCYMFWHQSAIFRESTKTKEHKSNTPIQVLITLTAMAFHNDSDGDQYLDWRVGFAFLCFRSP
jgi:acetylornithine/succinyldiaminopimelate/putrescine aminotransferase